MQRVVSGEDIHGLPTKYSSSDLQQQLQDQTLETSATITTTSPEPFGTSTNNNVTSSISDDAMSLEPFVFVVGSADGSAASAEAANVVENDSGDVNDNTCSSDNNVMMDVANTNTSSSSTTEYSTERDQQQQQQQLHSRLSVLSPLLPIGAGHSSHIPRTDSRNYATTFSSQGRQGSQNSSRDWGWFEDMHHSDHGNVVSDGTGTGIAVVQQQQQQQQRNIENSNSINSTVISGRTSSSDSNINNNGRKKYERMTKTARNNNKNDINENNKNNNNSSNNNIRPSIIDTATTRASLLPTGNEMIIDDMQEYLEPILVHPRSRDMENEAAVQAVTAPNYVLEESLSDQFLWKNTAGNRPPQPVEERAFFEGK
jgi:hypothetical protein